MLSCCGSAEVIVRMFVSLILLVLVQVQVQVQMCKDVAEMIQSRCRGGVVGAGAGAGDEGLMMLRCL